MKLPRIRALVLAAVPIGLAAALPGPMAGAANAETPEHCDEMHYVEYFDWGPASIYENYADEDSARGDWMGAASYNYLSTQYDHAGDLIHAAMDALGC
ncbi:MAG TPA: hypothetical protein VGI96_42040 [Streptosporangiaceae bacterium]